MLLNTDVIEHVMESGVKLIVYIVHYLQDIFSPKEWWCVVVVDRGGAGSKMVGSDGKIRVTSVRISLTLVRQIYQPGRKRRTGTLYSNNKSQSI
jgi:hypothetical protein